MNDQADHQQADEEVLNQTISDEILEAAGGRDGGRAISLVSTANRCIVC